MGNVAESLQKAMQIDGAMVTALVDYESGMTLGTQGTAFNVDLAASGNTSVVLSKMKVMQQLGLESEIEDILITLTDQYHLIRLLGMARHQLSAIEQDLEIA